MYIRTILLVLVVVVSCTEQRVSVASYYDIDSLVNHQVAILQQRNVSIQKSAVMGEGESQQIEFTPQDSAAWAKELEIIRTLDVINKPINHGGYDVHLMRDKKSNLTIKRFTANRDDLPVQTVDVYFLGRPGNIRKLNASYTEKNSMFSTRRELKMEFKDVGGVALLTHLQIDGGQKMFLGDTVAYSVKLHIGATRD